MRTSEKGINLITSLEGKHNKMYLCPAGLPTIGVGHLIKRDEDFLKTTLLSDGQIKSLLINDLEKFENTLNKELSEEINQAQFDSLISLMFNIGQKAFIKSTLFQRVSNKNDDKSIVLGFLMWNKINKVSSFGLTIRRIVEAGIFTNNKNIYVDFKDILGDTSIKRIISLIGSYYE